MKKKVGRVSDMADKRKNRDFEGNGKRKSQMVKSEKTWVPGKSGKSCEKGLEDSPGSQKEPGRQESPRKGLEDSLQSRK